jgi:predicted permease
MLSDLRYAVALLYRDRAVSALIVLVLAIGIAGNAAIFLLFKAAFLDPLPYPEADRLVTITERHARLNESGRNLNVSEFVEIRARSRTLEQIAVLDQRDYQLTGGEEPLRVVAARATPSFFALVGVNATFSDANSVLLTDRFWRTRLAADPRAVGRTLRLDGVPVLVAGILPADFQFDYPALRIPEPVDVYVPYPLAGSYPVKSGLSDVSGAVRVLARVRREHTIEQARAEIQAIAAALENEHREGFGTRGPTGFTLETTPLRDAIIAPDRSLLWLLSTAAAALLLIACANTAQLLLARSMRRSREVAIRTALGATRARLIRQFLAEALVLAACGGALGLLASRWLARLLVAVLPVRSPALASAHLDAAAIGFTLALSLLSALVFATVPAWKGSRWMPGPSLTARLTTGEGNRWRHAMIALEGALSVFLLCGAGLVAQNLWTLIATPTGFDSTNVLAMRLNLPRLAPNAIQQRSGLALQEYLDRIQAIPGVESAATVTGPPMRPARGGPTELVGMSTSVIADNHLVSPDYFRTLHIPLLAGRSFRRDDAGGVVNVAIVNQEFARRFGLGADVVGKQLFEPGQPIPIVGMVGNVRTRGLRTDPFPEVYLSSLQMSWANVYLVVRSAIPPAQLVPQVKDAIRSSNSGQAVYGVATMDQMIAESVAQPRFYAFVIGAFALLAVAMAAAGMYSVISCLVSQRTNEIAIRMALGASRRHILRAILGTTTAWMTAGLVAGMALALAARAPIRSLSSSFAGGSFWMYGAVACFCAVLSVLSAWLPMRRAAGLDASAALRTE